mmetsp:Transcript_65776/g.125394  ORF Transcript_65776/g.125394 Transcript_65776/m.125394 type:complete len:152 (-) Transcript_65776:33-488(-)
MISGGSSDPAGDKGTCIMFKLALVEAQGGAAVINGGLEAQGGAAVISGGVGGVPCMRYGDAPEICKLEAVDPGGNCCIVASGDPGNAPGCQELGGMTATAMLVARLALLLGARRETNGACAQRLCCTRVTGNANTEIIIGDARPAAQAPYL